MTSYIYSFETNGTHFAHRYPDQLTAEDVVNHTDEAGLVRILKKYGEEKCARPVARAIIDSRYAFGRITSTIQLAEIVATAFPGYTFLAIIYIISLSYIPKLIKYPKI